MSGRVLKLRPCLFETNNKISKFSKQTRLALMIAMANAQKLLSKFYGRSFRTQPHEALVLVSELFFVHNFF